MRSLVKLWHRVRTARNVPVTWTRLLDTSHHSWIKWSPVWLFVVPLVVKTVLKAGLSVPLPISFELFYFSALAALAGNLSTALLCPSFVKQYTTYLTFTSIGKGATELVDEYVLLVQRYHPPLRSLAKNIEHFASEYCQAPLSRDDVEALAAKRANALRLIPTLQVREANLQSAYWSLRGFADELRPMARLLCSLFYSVALLLVMVVLVRNAVIVIQYLRGH
jgi:hypothetical protein